MTNADDHNGTGLLRKTMRIVAAAAVALVCAVIVVFALNVPLNLSPFKDDIAAMAQETLGVGVAIDGELHLILGRWPAVEIRRLRLWRPSGEAFPEMLRLAHFKIGVAMMPLLKRELRIKEVVARGLVIELNGSDGSRAGSGNEAEKQTRQDRDVEAPTKKPPIRMIEVNRIDLRDAAVAIGRKEPVHTVVFSEISGSATDKDGLKLSVKGTYRNIPWDLAIEGNSLTALLARSASWPLGLSARGAGAELVVGGQIYPMERGAAFDVRLSGRVDPQLEALLGADVDAFEDYRIAFQLALGDSLVRVSALDGKLGTTRFTGDCEWNATGRRRRLTGAVNVAVLDLEPLIRTVDPTDGLKRKPVNETLLDGGNELFLSETVSSLDVDVLIAIKQIVGVPGDLRNATARLVFGDGRLHLPVSLNVLGTTVGGETILYRQEETMKFSVDLAADKTDLGRVAGEWYGGAGVTGRLDGLKLSASASGASLSALLKNLDARLDIRNVDLSIDGKSASRPMRVVLNSATVALPAGGDMQGVFTGKLLGESFSLNVTGGGMRNILEKSRWPVDLRFVGSGAHLNLTGIFSPLGDTVGPELSIRLSGDRIGALAAWTGISPSATMPYAMDAAGSLHRNRWHLEVRKLTLGNSTLKGSIGGKLSANQQPKTFLSVHSDTMDVAQLKTLFFLPDAGDRSATASKQPNPAERDFARILDTMIFPKDFHLPEMDLNLYVRRVLTEKLSYDGCSLKATIRRDRTTASRFQFALEESAFNGDAFLDLVRQPPVLGLRFSANRLDLGQLLEAFGVADGIDAGAGSFDVIVTTSGRRLAELIVQREISVRVQQGQWVLTNANTGAAVAIGIDSAEFSDKPGDPFHLDVGGHIQDTPLTMRLEIQKKRPNDALGDGLPYQLETETAGTRLALAGRMVFPLRKRGLTHRLSVSGDRLDSLEPLLNVSLPPWGPYQMTGVISARPEGYSLSDATVSIGDSRFLGQLYIETVGPRPKVTANLEATTLQLTDFERKSSALGEGRPATAGRQPGRSADNEHQRRLRQLLDPSSASPVDAHVSITVAEVLAGTNRLGSGKLRMARKANQISVSPLVLSIPGGDVNGTLDLSRINGGVQGTLKVEIHQLDYGPLLRLKDPNTENGGRVSLVIDLESTADSRNALLAQANGRVAVSIQPENIRARVFDFWAANLLTATLSVLNPDNASKINCIDADLVMADGIMKEKSIVIDTSKIRVRGSAHVDFKQQTVYLKLTPTPKRPQFISLATPIEVRGKFSDFGVGFAPGGLIGTAIRVLTAYIVVPIQWIILNKLPEDGRDVCGDAISNHFP